MQSLKPQTMASRHSSWSFTMFYRGKQIMAHLTMWASTKNIWTHSWALHSLVVESGSFEVADSWNVSKCKERFSSYDPVPWQPHLWGIFVRKWGGNLWQCRHKDPTMNFVEQKKPATKTVGRLRLSRLVSKPSSGEIPRSKFTAERCWTALLYGYVISMARFFGIKCIQMQHAPHMMVHDGAIC